MGYRDCQNQSSLKSPVMYNLKSIDILKHRIGHHFDRESINNNPKIERAQEYP